MRSEAIYNQVRKRTTTAFGKPLSLHLFRDCLATTLATKDPAHVLVARDLLGHATLGTTEKFYNQARMLESGRTYQDAVIRLRAGLTPPTDRRSLKGR